MKNTLFIIVLMSFLSASAQHHPIMVGAMKNVMWKGELAGLIQMDSLSKKGLYGMGPVEYLKGELMIWDGDVYQSSVVNSNDMSVKKTSTARAPFFAYEFINEWEEIELPEGIKSLKELELFLDKRFSQNNTPFFFKLEGFVDSANIHIVNLPDGKVVRSPDDAHQGQINYPVTKRNVSVLGFFSRNHKAIFTHHDTYIHTHLITQEKDMMGHLEEVSFSSKRVKLSVTKKQLSEN
jgi:acetolactate decarboxylase